MLSNERWGGAVFHCSTTLQSGDRQTSKSHPPLVFAVESWRDRSNGIRLQRAIGNRAMTVLTGPPTPKSIHAQTDRSSSLNRVARQSSGLMLADTAVVQAGSMARLMRTPTEPYVKQINV